MMSAKEKRRNCIWAVGLGKVATPSKGAGGLIRGGGADRQRGRTPGRAATSPGPHLSVRRDQHPSDLNRERLGVPRRGAPRLQGDGPPREHVGWGESLPRPAWSAWQRPASGYRRGGGVRGGLRASSALQERGGTGAPAAARMLSPRRQVRAAGEGHAPLALSGSLSKRAVSRALPHSHFAATTAPFAGCRRRHAPERPQGCGERTFRGRSRPAEARDAAISRWCCGPRHPLGAAPEFLGPKARKSRVSPRS